MVQKKVQTRRIMALERAYISWYNESGKEVPQSIKCSSDDGGDVLVRGGSHSHHTIEGEVHQGEEHEEEIPEELSSCPFKSNHCIDYNTIHHRL